jgi:hypothetical protein
VWYAVPKSFDIPFCMKCAHNMKRHAIPFYQHVIPHAIPIR